ncbi:MAG: hypothetical protein AAGD00_03030 [Planctomycetota bacterium]
MHRREVVIVGAIGTILGVAAIASFGLAVTDEEGSPLIYRLTGGSKGDTAAAELRATFDRPDARGGTINHGPAGPGGTGSDLDIIIQTDETYDPRAGVKDVLDRLSSDTPDGPAQNRYFFDAAGQTLADVDDPLGELGPPDRDSPFIGSWQTRSFSDDADNTIALSLRADGTFEQTADRRVFNTEERSHVETGGHWRRYQGRLVMAVTASSDTSVTPRGQLLVYDDANVRGSRWFFRDTDGKTRSFRRSTTEAGVPLKP